MAKELIPPFLYNGTCVRGDLVLFFASFCLTLGKKPLYFVQVNSLDPIETSLDTWGEREEKKRVKEEKRFIMCSFKLLLTYTTGHSGFNATKSTKSTSETCYT